MRLKENYKYTIVINQKAYVDLEIIISFELAALLNYLIEFCEEQDEKIEQQRSDGYTWMNYKKLLSDMPLLKGRTEASITGKLKQLEKYGFITTKNTVHNGRPRKYIKLQHNLCNVVKGDPIGGYNEEYYKILVDMGMNERQAKEVAADEEFLKYKHENIERTIKSERIENKAGYIWELFDLYSRLGI